jgi:hypothetical protein
MAVDQQLITLADNLFDFDPTINPANTADQNASAIGADAQASLGGCGAVKVSGADVTVSFGAPPGCTLPDGTVVSGTVAVAVTQSGAITTVALTLDSVVVNDKSISGTASFATSNGSMFTVKANLTSGTQTDVADLTVTGATDSFTVSGTGTVTQSGSTTEITFNDMVVTKGECYATGGSMSITKGAITETITFSATTPDTGEVAITVGKRTTEMTLPAYGSCPSGGSAPDAGRRHG